MSPLTLPEAVREIKKLREDVQVRLTDYRTLNRGYASGELDTLQAVLALLARVAPVDVERGVR